MRYYFDIRDHADLIRDDEGTEFPDLKAAHDDAIMAARELMAEALLAGKPIDGRAFEIRNGDRALLATVPFKEAIPPE